MPLPITWCSNELEPRAAAVRGRRPRTPTGAAACSRCRCRRPRSAPPSSARRGPPRSTISALLVAAPPLVRRLLHALPLVRAVAAHAALAQRGIARVGEPGRIHVGERHRAAVAHDTDDAHVERGVAQQVLEPQAHLRGVDDHLLAGDVEQAADERRVPPLDRRQRAPPGRRGQRGRRRAAPPGRGPRCSGFSRRRTYGVAPVRMSVPAFVTSNGKPRASISALTRVQNGHCRISAPHEQR